MTAVGNPESITWTAGPEDDGIRLDLAVASTVPGCSRNTAVRLIKQGRVLVNESEKKPGYRIAEGDAISSSAVAPAQSCQLEAEPLDIDVVFKDRSVIVINKPPGLVVHPAAGNFSGTLAHGLVYHFPELHSVCEEPGRPGIIHRLDKETSGLMVIARNPESWKNLAAQFKARSVEKTYIAFVHGSPDTDEGRITLPIRRHPVYRKKMTTETVSGEKTRHADTLWKASERWRSFAMLECTIKTGRTHQIRVHLSSTGHPVIGDRVYGYKHPGRRHKSDPVLAGLIASAPRQMLHAAKIAFSHPESGRRIFFSAPLPGDMTELRESILKHMGTQISNPENFPTAPGHDPVF
ncbi:MAG: RluA family pseudouridine synthase [Thermodesulfobacteriota bacterium]